MTLEDCTLSNNSASAGGGINNTGSLILENCTLRGNTSNNEGGGIYNEMGELSLTSCTLDQNAAGSNGGGIGTRGGTLSLTDCTLSGNSATTSGGGGLSSIGSASILTNCTLSGNSAATGGGIASAGTGSLTLENCTLSGNSAATGGGISFTNGVGTSQVTNTIIANSPQGRTCAGTLQSNGHNLDDDGGCGFFNTGDLSIVPAHLAPLGDYGGQTHTHAVCTGPGIPHPDCTAASPAIDAGDNAECPATDQRGAARPHGSACDIGAFESGAAGPPPPTPTPTITAGPTSTPGPCDGDCDGGGIVTVNELVTAVNIALGNAAVSACSRADANQNGSVTVDELVRAVNGALNGCVG
jgi:hypothetical protein